MLPLIKVFSLVLRAFSRPLINYTKRYHSSNKNNLNQTFRMFFIRVGNRYNIIETKINKKFLKIQVADDVFIKPLSDDVALDKGVEFFYEVIFYTIVLSLPLYEMWIQQVATQKKNTELSLKLQILDTEVKSLSEKGLEQSQFIESKINNLKGLASQNDRNTAEIVHQMNELKQNINSLAQLQSKFLEKSNSTKYE